MKYKIVKNEARKTITVIISPVVISYVKNLYEKYEGANSDYYFASAILKDADYKNDLIPMLKDIVNNLNEISVDKLPKGDRVETADIFTLKEDEYRLFGKNLDKEKNWDKQFKVSLKNNSKAGNKRFLFLDLGCQKPIEEDDGWKHYYAIEIEISVGYDEDKMEKYIYSVFHRAISVGERETSFQRNDSAWGGFDFEEEIEEGIQEAEFTEIVDDDFPF